MKKQRGITLIALVITIVVLLILAAISFAAIAGDDGILERARQAKEKTEAAQDIEKTQLGLGSAFIDKWAHGNEESYNNMINEIMTAGMMPKGLIKVEKKYNYSTNNWEDILYLIVEYKGSYYTTNFNNSSPSGIEEMLNNMVATSIADLKEENEVFLTVWTVDNSCLDNGIVLEDSYDAFRMLVIYDEQNYEFKREYLDDFDVITFTKSNVILEDPVLVSTATGNCCAFGLDESGHIWNLKGDYPLDLNVINNLENVRFTKIVAGNENVLMLDSNGKVWGYGDNYGNQFGMVNEAYGMNNSSTLVKTADVQYLTSAPSYNTYYYSPICISDISSHPLNGIKITDIDLSKNYNKNYGIALDNTGKVYYWGYFNGYEVFEQYDNPVSFKENSNVLVQKVSEAAYEWINEPTCINNLPNSTLNGVTITKISAGYNHALFLDSDGKIWSFGANGSNKSGTANYYGDNDMPICINDVEGNPLSGVTITEISAGYNSSMAIDSIGRIWSWGYDYGHNEDIYDGRFSCPVSYIGENYKVEKLMIEDRDQYNSNIPVCLSEKTTNPLYGVKGTKILAGYNHSLILDTQGKVWGFGENWTGQLFEDENIISSDGTTLPVCASDNSASNLYNKNIKSISAGYYNSGLVDNEGNYYLFGRFENPPK